MWSLNLTYPPFKLNAFDTTGPRSFSHHAVFTLGLFTLTFCVLHVAHKRKRLENDCEIFFSIFSFKLHAHNIFTSLDINVHFLNLLVVWSSLTKFVV